MGFLSRIFARRETTDPRYPSHSRVGHYGRTLAGVRITPDTAVTVPTVWACLRCISQTVAVLPWRVKLKSENGREDAPTHSVDKLIGTEPNPEWTSFQFRETLTHWALRWGNGYAEIERDTVGRPIALWPLHPERVCPMRDESGRLYYRVSSTNGAPSPTTGVDVAAADMFHLRGFGEGPVGVNVMDYAAESIGWAKAAQLFGAAFLGNGMNVAAVIESDKKIDETVMTRVKAALAVLYKGVRNAGKTLFLDVGMKFKSVAIDPDKGQFIATNQHLVEEICRWFGVPPHKVMHLLRSTNNNIEHQGIEFAVDTMTPWVRRWEQEADRKLFGANRRGYYTKMNMNALMRADAAARAAFYTAMAATGAYSANMILDLEDENTIGPQGDKHLVQLNLTTLDKVGEAPPAPAAAPAPKPPSAAVRRMIARARQRLGLVHAA